MSALLDTDVLCELLRERPAQQVLQWFADQPPMTLYVSVITQAEMTLGVKLLPSGERWLALAQAVMRIFDQHFAGRVLTFDERAAEQYAEITLSHRHKDQPISQSDAQVVAIATANRMALVTRNAMDFEGCGIDLINPWEDR